jgi:CBS domain containing-hemolysin-like protein
LTLANGFFVAAEFALTRLPEFEKEELQGSAGLRRASDMLGQLEIYLTACQLGISVSSILLGIVAEPAVTAALEPAFALLGLGPGTTSLVSVVVAIVIINLIHKVWGEQAPTYLGVEAPKAVGGATASPLYWWTTITYPIILLGDGIAKRTLALVGVQISRSWTEEMEGEDGSRGGIGSRAELRTKMSGLMQSQDISAERRQEIIGALSIGERCVREIMVPREEVVALSVEKSAAENFQVAAENPHSRFPPADGSLDRVVGKIYAPSLLRNRNALEQGEKDLEDLAAPPVHVSAESSISQLIDRLQEEGQELALVEENGEVAGLVTVTDAFEAIAGEVKDPLD